MLRFRMFVRPNVYIHQNFLKDVDHVIFIHKWDQTALLTDQPVIYDMKPTTCCLWNELKSLTEHFWVDGLSTQSY